MLEERRDLGEREGEVPPGRSSWGRGESESGERREEEETDCEEGRETVKGGGATRGTRGEGGVSPGKGS